MNNPFHGGRVDWHLARCRMTLTPKLRSYQRRVRQSRMVARAIKSKHHPILAHIIPMRRCNLSCAYCNEYDKVSDPVPTAEMLRRIELLAKLGTGIITISGGEPLLHPDLDEIIRAIRSHGAIATFITNGYLLTPERIQRLNRAGLEHLQISIDNVMPDEVSKKSLKVLDRKLEWLAEHAQFDININSVLGGGMAHPEDALTITRRALQLGFETTVGIIHDHSGQLDPLKPNERAVYDQILAERKPAMFAFAYDNLFHKNLALGQPNDWQCRAGSRYLYICEQGLVHYCSQQRGYPVLHRLLRAPGGHARPDAQPATRSPDPVLSPGNTRWAAATSGGYPGADRSLSASAGR